MTRVILSLFILLFCISYAWAAKEGLPKPANLPIEVTAQHLEADQGQRQATFAGKVVAKQADMTLYCDKLVVYSLPDRDEVDRLEAFGNVRFVQLDRTATADHAIYRQLDGTLLLSGNALVHQGQNQIAGDEIVVYLQEDRSVVKSGDSGRVKALLFPKSQQEQE